MSRKYQQNIYHENINETFTVEDVSRFKSGIKINIGMSAKIQKNITHVKKMIFGIPLHAVVKVLNI